MNIKNIRPLGFITSEGKAKLAEKSTESSFLVFLDRDGVINEEKSYITSPDDMQLYASTAKAIRKLNEAGAWIIVVTNQSGIARGYLSIEQLEGIHEKMFHDLKQQSAYVHGLFFCPHLPAENHKGKNENEYITSCNCRKPATGMFLNAIQKLKLKKEHVSMFMVGDSERDIEAGKLFGCKTIGVRSGHGCVCNNFHPDYLCNTLDEAADIILDKWK